MHMLQHVFLDVTNIERAAELYYGCSRRLGACSMTDECVFFSLPCHNFGAAVGDD